MKKFKITDGGEDYKKCCPNNPFEAYVNKDIDAIESDLPSCSAGIILAGTEVEILEQKIYTMVHSNYAGDVKNMLKISGLGFDARSGKSKLVIGWVSEYLVEECE